MDDGSMKREGESYWKDDHREMLSKSHARTVNFLTSRRGQYGVEDEETGTRPVTHRNPREQILPSVAMMDDEAEGAKKRARDLKMEDKRKPAQDDEGSITKTKPSPTKDAEESDDFLDDVVRFCSCRMITCFSAGIVIFLSTIVAFAIPGSRRVMDEALSGIRRSGEGDPSVPDPYVPPVYVPPPNGTVFNRHDLQMSIFGGLATRKKVPLPNLEGKFSPTYYPLHETLPVLWDVAHSGSHAAMDIMSYCERLTLANNKGSIFDNNERLEVITFPDNIAHYVNVDTTTLEGLEQADRWGLVESGLADAIATPHVPLVAELFSQKMKTGRLFAIFRNPVQRAVAEFVHLKEMLPEDPNYVSGIAHLQLYQYVQSGFVRENLLVRSLANVTIPNLITEEHVEIAKKVLEHYVLVGLSEDLETSMERFFHYFGWAQEGEWKTCQSNFIAVRDYLKDDIILLPESDEYLTLADRNWADMELYKHARYIYTKQARLKPRLKR